MQFVVYSLPVCQSAHQPRDTNSDSAIRWALPPKINNTQVEQATKKRNVWNEGRKSASTNKQQQKRPPWRCQWKKAYTPRLKEECWKKTWQRSWSNGVMRKNKHNEHQMDAVAIASSGFFPACLPRKKRRNKMCNSNVESWLAEKTTAFSWTASSSSCSFYLSSTVGSMHFWIFLHCISFGRLFIPLLKQTEFLDRTFSFSLNVLLVLFFSLVGSAIAPSMYVAIFFRLRVCDCSLTTCNVSYSQKENQSHTKHILMGYISPTKLNKHTGNSVLVCVCELFRTKFSFCDKNAFAGRLFIIRNATIQQQQTTVQTDCYSCHHFSLHSKLKHNLARFLNIICYAIVAVAVVVSCCTRFQLICIGHLTVVIYHKNVERWKTSTSVQKYPSEPK